MHLLKTAIVTPIADGWIVSVIGISIAALNQTKRDWQRDALADRSRIVTSVKPSARSFCAKTYDSGDSPRGPSPPADRIAPCPVWVSVSVTSGAAVRRWPDAERSGQRAVLFPVEWVADRAGLPGGPAHLRGGKRAPCAAKPATRIDALTPTLGACPAQDCASGLGLVSHAVELRDVSGRTPSAPRDYHLGRNHASLAP